MSCLFFISSTIICVCVTCIIFLILSFVTLSSFDFSIAHCHESISVASNTRLAIYMIFFVILVINSDWYFCSEEVNCVSCVCITGLYCCVCDYIHFCVPLFLSKLFCLFGLCIFSHTVYRRHRSFNSYLPFGFCIICPIFCKYFENIVCMVFFSNM